MAIRLQAVDANGERWRSSARFRADRRGRLALDRDAPVSASYRGIWGAGLLTSLVRSAGGGMPFFWPRTGTTTLRFDAVAGGRTIASDEVRRGLPEVKSRALSIADDGFYGRFFSPPGGRARGAPVLIFGGSEGGLSFRLVPALLAERGHPTLSLAYFGAPGLPTNLKRIPLEYFAGALRWLRRQTKESSPRVAVISVSRGSEAAQLLGVHYPQLVGAVVAAVPSNSALCDAAACDAPAWTFRGRPIPYTRQMDFTQPTDNPAAVIPVERIDGRMLLVCGGKDLVWRSCAYLRAIEARRKRFERASGDVVFAYPQAGHSVGEFLPYIPGAGRLAPADERAREDLWPQVVSFLARG